MGSKKSKQKHKKIKKEQEIRFENELLNNDNESAKEKYIKYKNFLEEKGISISTMTIVCSTGSKINISNFSKTIVLRESEIVYIKYGYRNKKIIVRTIVPIKKKKKKKITKESNFYNQLTIKMRCPNHVQNRYVTYKIFLNGSFQITGCKDMDDFYNTASTLIKILKEGKYVKNNLGEYDYYQYAEDPENIGIYNVRICLINSNFKVGYKIERKKLASILKEKHGRNSKNKEIGYVENKFEPSSGHSCVNIKYCYAPGKKVSIFVFQTGSIIITGKITLEKLVEGYHFINKILNMYLNDIRIVTISKNEMDEAIKKYKKLMTEKK